MHGLGQLMDGLGQLMLIPGQLLLVLGQLLVPCRNRTSGNSRQLVLGQCQLFLGRGQLILEGVELRQRGRKLELSDSGSARDLRYGRGSVFGRPFEKTIGDGDQCGAGEEEQGAVESGEPDPGGAAGPSQPRG